MPPRGLKRRDVHDLRETMGEGPAFPSSDCVPHCRELFSVQDSVFCFSLRQTWFGMNPFFKLAVSLTF